MEKSEFKYLKIAEILRNKILTKFWEPGDILPSENNLSDEYSVSRMTVRKAIDILNNEGYVISKPGKGNYVKAFTLNNFEIYYTPEQLIKGGFTKAVLLNADVVLAEINMVYHLQVAPYTKIVRIQTLIYQDELPVALDIKYIPYFPGVHIDEESLEYKSLKETISQDAYVADWHDEVNICGEYIEKLPSFLPNSKELEDYIPGFVLVFEEKLIDEDNIPLAYAKLFILNDFSVLEGQSVR